MVTRHTALAGITAAALAGSLSGSLGGVTARAGQPDNFLPVNFQTSAVLSDLGRAIDEQVTYLRTGLDGLLPTTPTSASLPAPSSKPPRQYAHDTRRPAVTSRRRRTPGLTR